MKRVVSLLIIIAVLLPGSLIHDCILIMVLMWIWRDRIKEFLSDRKNCLKFLNEEL